MERPGLTGDPWGVAEEGRGVGTGSQDGLWLLPALEACVSLEVGQACLPRSGRVSAMLGLRGVVWTSGTAQGHSGVLVSGDGKVGR